MPDLKITQLTEETSPVGADLMAIVDDVAGTPVTKKCTLTNLATLMGTLAPGGNSTYNSVYASPPASPVTGDLWFPPDSPYRLFGGLRYSGSAWVPTNGMTLPVDGDFAWVNQGTASVDASKGGIYFSTAADVNINWRIRKKAAPATPYTITAAFLSNALYVNAPQFGLVFRQSSDGKLNALGVQSWGGIPRLLNVNYINETTFNNVQGEANEGARVPVWLRIADDGTDRIFSYSADGENWTTLQTVARTFFLTADEVGFAINPENVLWGMSVTLLSWKET